MLLKDESKLLIFTLAIGWLICKLLLVEGTLLAKKQEIQITSKGEKTWVRY